MIKKFKLLFYISVFSFVNKPVFATSGLWATNDIRVPIVKNGVSYRAFNRTYLNDKSSGILISLLSDFTK